MPYHENFYKSNISDADFKLLFNLLVLLRPHALNYYSDATPLTRHEEKEAWDIIDFIIAKVYRNYEATL